MLQPRSTKGGGCHSESVSLGKKKSWAVGPGRLLTPAVGVPARPTAAPCSRWNQRSSHVFSRLCGMESTGGQGDDDRKREAATLEHSLQQ